VHGTSRITACVLGVLLVGAPLVDAAGADDPKAAFDHRVDTMKRMGRALYTTLGRVVRGKAELNPDAVAAAETVASLAATIDTLFPPGSNIGDSRAKPEIFAARPRVKELAAGVEGAATNLVAAAKGGDAAALAAAYKAQDEACEACHRDFRKPME
jgi:cytochrome c556